MEYCGAGSVSDIIRLRNKTVSKAVAKKFVYMSLYLAITDWVNINFLEPK